jgi:hypothetical protein
LASESPRLSTVPRTAQGAAIDSVQISSREVCDGSLLGQHLTALLPLEEPRWRRGFVLGTLRIYGRMMSNTNITSDVKMSELRRPRSLSRASALIGAMALAVAGTASVGWIQFYRETERVSANKDQEIALLTNKKSYAPGQS